MIKFNYSKKKIQDVKVGDYVKSLNLETMQQEPRRVLETFNPSVEVKNQRKITFSDGGHIINSSKHPILVDRLGLNYVKTRDLFIGDICLRSDGKKVIITAIERVSYEPDSFYDLNVDYNHNFYAGFNTLICNHNSVTITLPFYHYESELFSQLSDSKGTVETRARHTDQSIIINKWFLKKALAKEDIYLFHINEVPELYDALGFEDKFDALYRKYAKKVPAKHKKKVNAFELLDLFLYERMISGRLYFVLADNSFKGSFKENLYMSNLCCFAGDTPILTNRGEKPIKDLRPGDMVLSYNEKTHQTEFKKVVASKLTSPSREVLKIKYNGREVVCTPDHKFLTQRGWVEAQHLLCADKLVATIQGALVEVIKLTKKIPVYDIEVEGNHNFFANGLCAHNCEIFQPSHSLDGFNHITQKHNDTIPEIGVCILGNVNMGYSKIDDIPKAANFLVRFLDTMIDESDFGMQEIEYAAVNRRGLGIGISNLFGSLAKNKMFYNTQEAREFVNDFMESLSWHLHKTSIELAEEKGPCTLYEDTVYSDGVFPHERFENPEFKPKLDWDYLRNGLQKFGIRNSSLSAVPPAGNCIQKNHRIKTYEGDLNLEDICKRENVDISSLQRGWYDLKTPIKLPTKDGDSLSRKFYYNGKEKVYKIELENGEVLRITKNHKLLVRRKSGRYSWVKACDLKEGDDIQTIEEIMKIKKIELSQSPEETWDLEVDNYHNYILENGAISHNSAELSNSTNGIEPPRELVTIKTDKSFTFKKLVPYYKTSKNFYTTAWSGDFSNAEYLKLVSVIQHWVDQAISLNLYTNLLENPKVPIGELIELLVDSLNLGIKTWYYQNFRSTEDESDAPTGCESGGCSV